MFYKTNITSWKGREEGATCLLCSVYVRLFMGGMEQNGAADSVIWLREKCVLCLSVEVQQIEWALTHNANDLYVNRGHILIFSQSNIIISHTARKNLITLRLKCAPEKSSFEHFTPPFCLNKNQDTNTPKHECAKRRARAER